MFHVSSFMNFVSPRADLHCGPRLYQRRALLPELRGRLIPNVSRREESNPQPLLYKSTALPLSYFGFMCAGQDSNLRSRKAWVLQTHVIDRSTTCAYHSLASSFFLIIASSPLFPFLNNPIFFSLFSY